MDLNMLFYFVIGVTLILQQCECYPSVIPQEKEINLLIALPKSNLKSPAEQLKAKRDLLEILNSLQNRFETGDDHLEDYIGNVPKITVWEFPTERRVFIDDEEIFVNSQENSDELDEHVVMQSDVLHHHKHVKPEVDKDIIQAKEFPAFRPPSKKDGNPKLSATDSSDEAAVNRKNGDPKVIVPDISDEVTVNREKRNTNELGTARDLEIDGELNVSNDRPVRTWGFYNYLKQLLRHLKEARLNATNPAKIQKLTDESFEYSSSSSSSSESVEVTITDQVNVLPGNVRVIMSDADKNGVNLNKLSETDGRLSLLPLDPDVLKALLEELKNEKIKRLADSLTDSNSSSSSSVENLSKSSSSEKVEKRKKRSASPPKDSDSSSSSSSSSSSEEDELKTLSYSEEYELNNEEIKRSADPLTGPDSSSSSAVEDLSKSLSSSEEDLSINADSSSNIEEDVLNNEEIKRSADPLTEPDSSSISGIEDLSKSLSSSEEDLLINEKLKGFADSSSSSSIEEDVLNNERIKRSADRLTGSDSSRNVEGGLKDSSSTVEGGLKDSSSISNLEGGIKDSSSSIEEGLKDSSNSVEGGLKDSSISIEGGLKDSSSSVEGGLKDSSSSLEGGHKADNDKVGNILSPIEALFRLLAANSDTVKLLKDKSDSYLS